MGSIDESALQNLNMVVNLTKHIHIKANGTNEDVDCDEYAQYFPSFMWIVRDFTLQLVDEDEENINSNQYLEKALEEQKGFSDKIEEKNRIRRLLKSFFKERQCYTMIRPVTDEESLQNLDKMSENDFRPDFLEQVTQLRKKVTHCVKPKLLSGKQLSPMMFLSLAENYVTAINKGAVPNIENAWTYICQNESKKALEKAVIHFDDDLNKNILYSLPMEENELKDWFREIKYECKQIFNKSSVGDVVKEHREELKFQLQMKFEKVLQENERECGNSCSQFLDTEYIQIENKLKSNKYQDFYEYESELQGFKEYYYREAPAGPIRNECLLHFINDKLIESIDSFIKRFTNELEVQKQLSVEQERSLKAQIEELKEMRNKDRDESDSKMTKLTRELAQIKASHQSLEESLKTEQECSTSREKDLKDKLKKEKIENERKLDILKSKEEESRRRENESKQKYMSEHNEHVQAKALLVQKVDFLTKNLEEYKIREERLKEEQEQEREAQLEVSRTRQKQYDQKLFELTHENENFREQILDLEERIESQQREYEQIINDLETKVSSNENSNA